MQCARTAACSRTSTSPTHLPASLLSSLVLAIAIRGTRPAPASGCQAGTRDREAEHLTHSAARVASWNSSLQRLTEQLLLDQCIQRTRHHYSRPGVSGHGARTADYGVEWAGVGIGIMQAWMHPWVKTFFELVGEWLHLYYHRRNPSSPQPPPDGLILLYVTCVTASSSGKWHHLYYHRRNP